MKDDSPFELPDNSEFSIKVSENMELRNILRSGLFEAQGSETDKTPLFVSWPSWLEDGIVCIYASDLHALLCKTIRDTAASFEKLIERYDETSMDDEFIETHSEAAPDDMLETTGDDEPETDSDEARKAARAILEQPLEQHTDSSLPEETGEETADGEKEKAETTLEDDDEN